MAHHLAQLNIARWAIPDGHPGRAEFESLIDGVNAAADAAPGFVWRLQSDEGNALSFRFLNDPDLIVNLSVWESWEHLKAFTYQADHLGVFRRRSEWFTEPDEAVFVLWWVPAGHVPDLDEAGERLTRLRDEGPSPEAFTPAQRFPPG